MVEALTALFAILIFYTVLSICGLIQFVTQRHRARQNLKKAAGQQV